MTGERLRIGYQGEPGAYGEAAARLADGADADPIPVSGFDRLLDELCEGRIDRAVLPVENTIVGAVEPALAALFSMESLFVVGEVTVPVHHCLLARPGTEFADIRRVLSHPVALAQCGEFLKRHSAMSAEAAGDTAGAARIVSESGDATAAAIASRAASERYGLAVIAEAVQDTPDNATRFWLLAREPRRHARGTIVRSAYAVSPATSIARISSSFASVGTDLHWLCGGPSDHVCDRSVVELTHRAGPPSPGTLLRHLAPNTSVRPLGSWTPAASQHQLESVPLWAVRGAITVNADDRAELHAATQELLGELLRRNAITADDVLSAVFTVTPDLTSDFPAHAARAMGWTDVPLLCATEIAVEGALQRCVRVLLQVHGPVPAEGIRHAYLREAARLRPDLAAE